MCGTETAYDVSLNIHIDANALPNSGRVFTELPYAPCEPTILRPSAMAKGDGARRQEPCNISDGCRSKVELYLQREDVLHRRGDALSAVLGFLIGRLGRFRDLKRSNFTTNF